MAHSENAAGYMADGYSRVSGKPGICMAQSIGAANLAAGIYDASLSNTPVIAITGKKPNLLQYTGAYQEGEHRLLFEGITKFQAETTDPNHIPFVMRRLFKDSVTGKPGPVHWDLPNNCGVTAEFAEINEAISVEESCGRYPSVRMVPADKGLLQQAAVEIGSAKNPLLIVGRGAVVSGAKTELHEFARKADIPVVTTPDGKTILDESDPLWTGIVGTYGMVCANRAAAAADLVIFVGTQASDQTTNGWTLPLRNIKTVQIDIDPRELGMKYPDTIGLQGDVKAVLQELIPLTEETKRPDWRNEVFDYVEQTLGEYRDIQFSENKVVTPERLCLEVSQSVARQCGFICGYREFCDMEQHHDPYEKHSKLLSGSRLTRLVLPGLPWRKMCHT